MVCVKCDRCGVIMLPDDAVRIEVMFRTSDRLKYEKSMEFDYCKDCLEKFKNTMKVEGDNGDTERSGKDGNGDSPALP